MNSDSSVFVVIWLMVVLIVRVLVYSICVCLFRKLRFCCR